MGFFDKLIDDVIMAPVKVALLPFRVLCVAVGSSGQRIATHRLPPI